MTRALLPAAYLEVRIGARGYEHADDLGLPLDGSAETVNITAKIIWTFKLQQRFLGELC